MLWVRVNLMVLQNSFVSVFSMYMGWISGLISASLLRVFKKIE